MTPLLTLPQAAATLQVSPRSVRRLVDAGEPILHPDALWAIQTASAILQQGYPVRRH